MPTPRPPCATTLAGDTCSDVVGNDSRTRRCFTISHVASYPVEGQGSKRGTEAGKGIVDKGDSYQG